MRCFLGIELNGRDFSGVKLPEVEGMHLAKNFHITLVFFSTIYLRLK